MFHFYDNWDLQGPTDHLNYFSEEQWEEVYRRVPSARPAKLMLQQLLDKLRVLVQKYSDLLWNPYRTSNDPQEYNTYWVEYYHWYIHEKPTLLRELRTELEMFIKRDAGKIYFDDYPNDRVDGFSRSSYEYKVYCIFSNQYGVLKAFQKDFSKQCNDSMIRRNLNPTARGAKIFMWTGNTPTVTKNL